MDEYENDFDNFNDDEDFDDFSDEILRMQNQGITPEINQTMQQEWNDGLVQEYFRHIVKRLKAFKKELKKEGFSEEEASELTLSMCNHIGLV